jgi:hypothetical protein
MKMDREWLALVLVAAGCVLAGPLVWAGRGSAGRRMLSPLAMLVIVGNDVYCEGDGGPCTAACYGDPNDPGSYSGCWAIFSQGPQFDNGCDARGCSSGSCGTIYVQYAQNMYQVPVGFVSSSVTQTVFDEVQCFRYVECITGAEEIAACINRECHEPDPFNYRCSTCVAGRGGPWFTDFRPREVACELPYGP